MGPPRQIALSELVDIPQDGKFTLREGCAPNLVSAEWELTKNGFGFPSNNEFVYQDGDEQCGLCPFNYGNDCGNSGFAGHRGGVKRINYLGDPDRCCIANIGGQNVSKIDTASNTTCRSDYTNPSSSQCGNTYMNYCSDSNIVTNPECKKLSTSNTAVYNKLMTNYCNTDGNVSDSTCIDWCKTNSTSCTKLNNITDCEKYGISSDTCSPQAIVDIKTKCQKYGMLSEQGLPVGNYACSGDGLKTFKNDCKKYNIALNTCNANGLDAAYTANLSRELATSAQQQSDAQFKVTQTALSQVLDLPTTTTDTTKNKNITLIIVIIILFLLSMSLIVGGYVAFN